jgi:hypothetical protein
LLAGLALIAITALTTVGLYAIVEGGLGVRGAAGRSSGGGVPLLVTIQAGPATGTPAAVAAETPTVAAPGAARPAPAPASTAGATTASATAPQATASVQAPTPAQALETPAAERATVVAVLPPSSRVEPRQRATHDGLVVEILEVERDWKPTNLDGSSVAVQPRLEIAAVLVQISSQSPELRFLDGSDLILVGPDGARFAPRPSPLAREPRLLRMPVLPGDVVRGWLTYVVPSGTRTTRARRRRRRSSRGPPSRGRHGPDRRRR